MAASSLISHNIPKLQLVQKRYADMVTLAAEKVTRHILHPSQYPLPATGKKSLERALYDVIMELPRRKRDDFIDRFKTTPGPGTPQRVEKFGDLHSVDLLSRVPVAEQIKNIPVPDTMKFTQAEIRQIEALLPPSAKPVKRKGKPVPRQAVAANLDFIVDSITCIDTNDIRKDEISMGGFATDAAGENFNKDPFFVSKFKKGETVSLGAKGNFFSFSLDAGSTGGNFPLTFVAGIFINEEDLIGNKKLARRLTILLSVLGLSVMTAGILVMTLLPPAFWVGMAIFLFGSAVFIFGKDIIPFYLTDEVGIPVTDIIVFDTPPAPGETVVRTLELPFDLGGGFVENKYTASIRWVTS